MGAQVIAEKRLGRQFVFSLALAVFGTGMLDVLASLFLIDIANTFLGNSNLASIAIVSQVVTLSSIAAVVFGVLNGFLSVKVNHKRLLLLGALCIIVGTVGCFLAPSFLYMLFFYPFDGVGTIIVGSMAFALIGESLPLKQRARSIGIVTAGGIFSSGVGFAFAGYIAVIGGWRSYLLWYVLPISFIAISLAYLSIPSQQCSKKIAVERASFWSSFREVLANKSAAACLFGYMLMAVAAIWSFFTATFLRNQFSITVQDVGIVTFAIVMFFVVGSIVGGRVIDLFGRKPIVVISWTARGLLIASIVFMPNFWSAFIMSCLSTFTAGIVVTSAHSLSLEQVRKSRGTMMSLSGVFASVGASAGVALGGLVLGMYGFQLLSLILGLFGVSAALLIFFFAKDPTQDPTRL